MRAEAHTHTHTKGPLFIIASNATPHRSPQGGQKLGYILMKDVGNDDLMSGADDRVTSEVNQHGCTGRVITSRSR